jgi:hypothetical protein
MLSLPAITADSNACRHPTIEVINPSPLSHSHGAPGQHQTGTIRILADLYCE